LSVTSRLVWSSDGGKIEQAKKRGGKRRDDGPGVPAAPDDGTVRVWRVKGGRGGKTVTLITGLPKADVERLAVDLRRSIGTGGGVRDGAVEVQGDHRERVQKKLTELGFRVKLAGG
jgi:translation initiation factor 1